VRRFAWGVVQRLWVRFQRCLESKNKQILHLVHQLQKINLLPVILNLAVYGK
jgi:hypothetical protein